MKHIDIGRFNDAALRTKPFTYTVVPDFLNQRSLSEVIDSYPDISSGGSYPLETVDTAPVLREVIDELNGPEFERAVAEKFQVDLAGRPKIFTLRGYCRSRDGKIHTDSTDKIITALLYLNEQWHDEHGKLRLLRSGEDLEDYAEEVPPDNGTLLIFRRADNSWHGHGPFEGVRRSIQMNWITSEKRKTWHRLRHSLSAGLKKIARR